MSENRDFRDEDILCNLCGHSCLLHEPSYSELNGLIKARVHGGYSSTPGNGFGALDDTTAYTFSMCEFCLDWLFTQFKIPVKTTDYLNSDDPKPEPWRPAAQRVAEDSWRKMKDEFYNESSRRALDREDHTATAHMREFAMMWPAIVGGMCEQEALAWEQTNYTSKLDLDKAYHEYMISEEKKELEKYREFYNNFKNKGLLMNKFKASFIWLWFKIVFWLGVGMIFFGLKGNNKFYTTMFNWGISVSQYASRVETCGHPLAPDWKW